MLIKDGCGKLQFDLIFRLLSDVSRVRVSFSAVGLIAQLVEQLQFFQTVLFFYSSVVQSVDRKTVNLDVGGSSPSRGGRMKKITATRYAMDNAKNLQNYIKGVD